MHSLKVRTPQGDFLEILQHLHNPDMYPKDPFHRGAVIGPYAGRIGPGPFQSRAAACKNHSSDRVILHGGSGAWSKQHWQIRHQQDDAIELFLSPTSIYPGSPSGSVRYSLTGDSLKIQITAQSLEDTHLNLTHHAYFCLDTSNSITHHTLKIPASTYLKTSSDLIPTGEFCEVLPDMDFRKEKLVLFDSFRGLDHCFVLHGSVAELFSQLSGLRMTLKTLEPGLVVYTPETLPVYCKEENLGFRWPAICLEPQGFPDAMHQKAFPSTEALAGVPKRNEITLSFAFAGTG